MPDVSRSGRANGQDVRSDEHYDDGSLFDLPQGAWRAGRLFHVPFLAGSELTMLLWRRRHEEPVFFCQRIV